MSSTKVKSFNYHNQIFRQSKLNCEGQWYASGIEHLAKIDIVEGACLAIHNCSIFMTVEDGVKVLSFKVWIILIACEIIK